ncbi:thioredoxin fold domain-containing protein [Thermodesulfobacteriota bacterium]
MSHFTSGQIPISANEFHQKACKDGDIRVDFDLEKEIVRRYGVQGIPDLWFLDSQGKRFTRSTGFIPADTLLSILKYINEDAFRNMSFREFLRQK